MNNLLIPPSPNWYESSILACAPDNTLLYGSRCELVIINNVPLDKPGDITLIPRAHSERIKCVVINPLWGNPEKLAVTVSEDKIVRLWNIELLTSPHSHNAHTTCSEEIVGATFSGNDKVVSVSENGFIVVWRLGTNEITSIKDLLGTKVKVSCVSSCPHAPWLTAFGLKNGLVVLTDLKKSGKVLYRLRGHDKGIVSLSWCPVPINIFPGKSTNKKQNHDLKGSKEKLLSKKEIVEVKINAEVKINNTELKINNTEVKINNTEVEQNIQNTKTKMKPNLWVGLKHADDDEIQEEPEIPVKVPETDFLTECELLRKKIAGIDIGAESKEIKDEIVLHNKIINENGNSRNNSNEKKPELIGKHETENNSDLAQEVQYPKEFLLVSSSRGGPLFIWRAGTDGAIQTELWFSGTTNSRKVRKSEKNFIVVNWITPNILLSSSLQGELLKWDLLAKKIKPILVHNDHSNILFSIAAPVQILQKYEPSKLQDDSNLHAWTIGLDRQLLNTKLGSDRRTLISYPTFGGFANCFKSSPFDPTRIAIGVSDGTTNIWDLSRENLQCVTMVKVWQRMQSSVTAISWHPHKESMLAYGTQEGRIGLINSFVPSKPPTLLTKYFRTAIYRMDWGPLAADKKTFGLYVCAAGKLAVYNVSKLLEDPTIIEIEDTVTEVTWKNDYSIMAVGTKFSSVFIFNSDLKLVTKLYLQQKSIYYLIWHPDATVAGEGTSKFRFWLAIGITDANVLVCDLSEIDLTRTDVEYNSKNFIVRRLQGHTKTIRDICWSPHEEAKLASAGEDGLIQVWDVENDTILSTFLGHNSNPVMSVIWSPADKNYIISSSKDNTVRIWNITEHPPKKEIGKLIQKNKGDTKIAIQKDQSNVEVKSKKIARDLMLPYTCKMQSGLHDLYIINKLADLNESEETQENIKKPDILKLFGDRNDVTALLDYEQNRHKERGKFVCSQHLSLWKGDFNEALKEAIERNAVTPWLISLAPMVSPKLWLAACECYAKKLAETENSNPFETASYYLACHKVEEAIEVLHTATFYREALAIAKSRLSPSDPLINEVLLKWAKYCYSTGNYEIAAECFAALKKYEEAAKVLSKRNDLKTLQIAAKLAKKSENKDLLDAIMLQCKSIDENQTEVVNLPSRINAIMFENQNEFSTSSPLTEHTDDKELNKTVESHEEEKSLSSMELTCESFNNLEPITTCRQVCDMELTCQSINNECLNKSESPDKTKQMKTD